MSEVEKIITVKGGAPLPSRWATAPLEKPLGSAAGSSPDQAGGNRLNISRHTGPPEATSGNSGAHDKPPRRPRGKHHPRGRGAPKEPKESKESQEPKEPRDLGVKQQRSNATRAPVAGPPRAAPSLQMSLNDDMDWADEA